MYHLRRLLGLLNDEGFEERNHLGKLGDELVLSLEEVVSHSLH